MTAGPPRTLRRLSSTKINRCSRHARARTTRRRHSPARPASRPARGPPNSGGVHAGRAADEPACRPGSVHPLARAGGHPSGTAVAGSLVRSTREHRAGRPRTLAQAPRPGERASPLDLAPGGVYLAARITRGAGGLLHHRFTLTSRPGQAGPEAVCFLWHCPAGRPGSALPTTLPCGARTFLDMTARAMPRPPGRLVRRETRIFPRLPNGCRCARTGRLLLVPGIAPAWRWG